MDKQKPQLVKVEAFCYFLWAVLQHPHVFLFDCTQLKHQIIGEAFNITFHDFVLLYSCWLRAMCTCSQSATAPFV